LPFFSDHMTTIFDNRLAISGTKVPKAAELVAAELRHHIVSGRLKPGDKLHSENVLQTEFEISRPTMREALRILESESLIKISRGKHGGSRVSEVDLGALSRQVGVMLQIGKATLQDVWQARLIIEPPAAGMLAAQASEAVFEVLEENIAQAKTAARTDLILYADLSAEFSILITRHCGNQTLNLFASLIYDIIRRQHEHVTKRTMARTSVDRLREQSIRSRQEAVALMRQGDSVAVERFWKKHIEHMRDLVLAAYDGPVTLDVLNEPARRPRAVSKVRRASDRTTIQV
jgi:GntR family transcriptional repressor for pyruvate dehydrogenase complex